MAGDLFRRVEPDALRGDRDSGPAPALRRGTSSSATGSRAPPPRSAPPSRPRLRAAASARSASPGLPAIDRNGRGARQAAAAPQVHQGEPLPACCALKKCRITAPATTTSPTIATLVARRPGERVMVGQHQEDAPARSGSCCGSSAASPAGRAPGSGVRPAMRLATTFLWFGMMTRNTLAVIQVAIIAPVCRKAARPLNTSVKQPGGREDVERRARRRAATSLRPRGERHRPS